MRMDKKADAGSLRWVLPRSPGQVELVRDIDEAIVDAALALIVRPPAA